MIYRRNKKGQMAILIALAFGLMFLLIAMVVNIGFLVAAKINLQNATDLAAYAGAAQQARYLSEIGKWNYEMRRNYKAMVFDYMIVLNGERRFNKNNVNDQDFKKYIITPADNPNGAGVPYACASLQRQGSTPTSTPALTITCQTTTSLNFQNAIAHSQNALISNASALISCLDADPTACQGVSGAAQQQSSAYDSLVNTDKDAGNGYANYENFPYNYNRRLIGWMLHDYRHLQARIRGVHMGDITLGRYDNGDPFGRSSGRWLLQKRKAPITIFENSPISVAAKVINGYTSAAGSLPSDGVTPIVQGVMLSNPVHNAAFATFKKNLMDALHDDAKLYTLTPKSKAGSSGQSNTMAEGCGGTCPEFNGAYLKLDNHDVNFWVRYTLIKENSPGSHTYSYGSYTEPIMQFPVGVAKDRRIYTYYTVVGTANTKNIPFNVFFGGQDKSHNATMVAVAAARPFGSRIGPSIDDDCTSEYLNGKGGDSAKTACESKGLDPLYPFETSNKVDKTVPNFSLSDANPVRLGVKLCVDKTEYGPITSGTLWGVLNPSSATSSDVHSRLYQMGSDQSSRWRTHVRTISSITNYDDGFPTRQNPLAKNSAENGYFDNDSNPVHPFGTRDSVTAWNGPTVPASLNPAQKDNYETYLDKYKGNAIYPFGQITDRKSGGQLYKVYVLKYPDIENDSWDIEGLTKIPDEDKKMEKAFANAMAVNMFEATRYILPYRKKDPQSQIPENVMNYIVNTTNNGKPFLFGGVKNTEANPVGLGNVKFADQSAPSTNNMIKEDAEGTGGLGVNSAGDVFAETYTAWRFGSRGYRVKLVNIQDLISSSGGNNNKIQNPLETTYLLPDNGITIDLSSIKY